jgi:hypothetical protein
MSPAFLSGIKNSRAESAFELHFSDKAWLRHGRELLQAMEKIVNLR